MFHTTTTNKLWSIKLYIHKVNFEIRFLAFNIIIDKIYPVYSSYLVIFSVNKSESYTYGSLCVYI